MSIIKVENLTFSYPNSYVNIFENVRFQIDTDWKLGFIGRNGRGKTTFFNLLLGKYEYRGKIISSVEFDCFPYHVEDKSILTSEVLYQVCPTAEEWELIRELSYLDVKSDVIWRPFETLSNGEQTKVLLAALFLNEEHFLLIDEPTNHLDMKAREIVAKYLKRKKGFILISHDRCFLDECTDHILSINKANIEVQSGNFSSWMNNFNMQQQFELSQNERLQKDIQRLQKAAMSNERWSNRVESSKKGAFDKGYVGHKAAKMMKRSKAVEVRQNRAIEQKSKLLKNIENAPDLKISPLCCRSEKPVSFSEVVVYYDNHAVCNPVSFEVKQGDRIALDGKNGCGKSSLLKLLSKEAIEYSGNLIIGSDVVVSFVPQDVSGSKGNLSDFASYNHLDESLFKAILRKMDFDRTQFEKDMSDFSEGQKKKVWIAKSLCERAHLYVWDEPLNYIDVYSRMQIEQLIEEFSPTMIFVEHDKAFREKVATITVSI